MKIAVVFDTPYRGWTDADFRAEMGRVEEAEYEIADALLTNGHAVRLVGVNDDLHDLSAQLAEFQPDYVFNCAESFESKAPLDYVFPAVLEAEGYRYTGSPPVALLLTRNKGVSKKVLAYHGIRVPGFVSYRPNERVEAAPPLAFPLVVKPMQEDASAGIAKASVVYNLEALAERVAFVHANFAQSAIAEEYVEGRELYVSVVGNGECLEILPIVEMVFDKQSTKPEERIATQLAKWDEPYRERNNIRNVFARPIAQTARERLEEACRVAFNVLGLRDYARFDVRLTADQEIWVIEANANPFISFGHDVANAAEKAGMDYEAFVERILQEAVKRYEQPT